MADARLGEIDVPSGTVTLLDPGHIGMFLNEELAAVPVVRIDGLPRDRALPVVGRRLTSGEFSGSWDWVAIVVADGEVTERESRGQVMVDHARILLADDQNNDDWIHDDTIDGLADFVFWGRDAASLAQAVGAPAIEEGFGWQNLPIAEIVERGTAAEQLHEERGWKLATDFRPHSHHWQAMALVRSSPTESGTIDVGGRKVCLFTTSWGDGLFPAFCDRAANGDLLRVRIQLHTKDSAAAMREVNA